jgi:hypothetical protein
MYVSRVVIAIASSDWTNRPWMAWWIGLEILLEALNESERISVCRLQLGYRRISYGGTLTIAATVTLRNDPRRLLKYVSQLSGMAVG